MRYTLLAILLAFAANAFGLSVTPSPSTLNCGTTLVNFTFDCDFNGSVLVPPVPAGVTIDGPITKTVTDGALSFNVTLTTEAPATFNIKFVVISSDAGCAVFDEEALAAMTSNCIAPDNDFCVDAAVMELGVNSCTPEVYSTLNATESGNTPSCGGDGYLDLWYYFDSNNDTIVMEIPAIPGTVGYYALYDGCPGDGGSEVDCSIMIQSLGSTFEMTGLTVDQGYYVQILFLPGNEGMDQEICFHSTVEAGCDDTVTISDLGPYFPNESHAANLTIETTGSTTITASDIIYSAGDTIRLNGGFDSGTGGFEANIADCPN